MFGFISRRRKAKTAKAVAAASRFIVEALERRTLFDGVIFDSSHPDPADDPNGNYYYGVQTDCSQLQEWAHQVTFTSSDLPAHSHVSAQFNVALDIQIDPNTGNSIWPGTADDNGDVILTENNNVVADWNLDDGTSTSNAGISTTGGLTVYNVMDNSSTVTWQIQCTSALTWVNTMSFAEQAGTSVGFANAVETDRGGQDGSVTIGLDGPCSQDTSVYFTMSDNGMLAQPGTGDADLQLPWNPGTDQPPSSGTPTPQPYYTFQGSGVSLDWPDSHPGLDSIVYAAQIPAGQTQVTLNLHMVAPYFGVVPDYPNGILASVDPLQPAANVIPMAAGWADPLTGVLWAASSAPPAQTYRVSPHVTSTNEWSLAKMGTSASIMANWWQMPTQVNNMETGLARSQYEHDNLTFLLGKLGGRILNAKTVDLQTAMAAGWVTLSDAGRGVVNLPSGPGSLWTAADEGDLDENSTEKVGLSVVDDDVFGSFDLTWWGPSVLTGGPTINPNYYYDVDVSSSGKVAGKPGFLPPLHFAPGTYSAEYPPGTINEICILLNGTGVDGNSRLSVTVTAWTFNPIAGRIVVGVWQYSAGLSSS